MRNVAIALGVAVPLPLPETRGSVLICLDCTPRGLEFAMCAKWYRESLGDGDQLLRDEPPRCC